jgi:hypothetical protein
MKSKLIIVSILIICGCKGNKNDWSEKNDSITQNIIGKWGGLGESTPVLKITADSIYYFDTDKTYSYKIISRDVVINFPEYKRVLKNVSIEKDTMVFYDDLPEPIRAFRFKN